jgi:hypothetical protein
MFSIPNEYIGVEIEIIAFTRDEALYQKDRQKKVTFTSLTLDTRKFKFNRDEANER